MLIEVKVMLIHHKERVSLLLRLMHVLLLSILILRYKDEN